MLSFGFSAVLVGVLGPRVTPRHVTASGKVWPPVSRDARGVQGDDARLVAPRPFKHGGKVVAVGGEVFGLPLVVMLVLYEAVVALIPRRRNVGRTGGAAWLVVLLPRVETKAAT